MDTGHTPGTVRGDPSDADSFGLTLRRLRERAGLTQEQLAERAGISANAVSSLERGTRGRPYPHTRDALARALGITGPRAHCLGGTPVATRSAVSPTLRLVGPARSRPGDRHCHTAVALASGSMAAAEALLREYLPAIEARGAEWPLAVALGIQGRVVSVLGDHERADALLRRAVRIFGRLDDTWGMAHQLTHVADVASLRGDHTRAALHYGAVDALGDQVGVRVFHIWQELSDTCQAATMTTLGVERCADGPVGRQS